MEHEMNFLDLCVACGRAIRRACRRCGVWLIKLLRLTFRFWWIVIPVMLLAVGVTFYYTRPENVTYKVQGVAMLNGVSIDQFNQRYRKLQTPFLLPDQEPLKNILCGQKAKAFEMFYVVDALNDSVADYVDYKRKSNPSDTVNVRMQDRIAVQFRMKSRDLGLLPEIERHLLTFFNADESMQKSYALYVKNLARELRFNHDQVEKLDSLTSEYYFKSNPGSSPLTSVREGLIYMGDWKVHMFLDHVYAQQARTERMDYRASFVTAPVTLENHLVVNPKPVNRRRMLVPLFMIAGWLFGCCLAALIEQRKRIISLLKK